jgi:hypothetical protein
MHGTIITILQPCKAWHPTEGIAIHAPSSRWFMVIKAFPSAVAAHKNTQNTP